MRRQARAAVARSTVGDRWLAVLVGLVLLVGGVLVALLSYGVFGTGRAARPLLDPMIVDALRAAPDLARGIAVAVGVLLVAVGLAWAARAVRPERRPDLVLERTADTAIVVSSTATAEAVQGQAATIPGVVRARARTVGADDAPAVRVTLWLADDADARQVLAQLDERVLAVARESLGIGVLPVAVRLELDTAAPHPRVA
ncbi:hypothetical protein BJF78_22235 [Pseudonocardia sp. CNS-139]|nr:hypothetical protein BJF78_22235 [Pseudonocardia sp. CNS-139]